MDKNNVKELIERFAKRFYKKENYYSMDYGTRFNPTRDPKTNKIKYKKSPGDIVKPFWFVGQKLDYRSYENHITKFKDSTPVRSTKYFGGKIIPLSDEEYKRELENRKEANGNDMGIILPPCDLNGDSETKGQCNWGAFDEDKYLDPEHIKRIVKQIYDEKLPLAPCYSKSGGLHVYVFAKDLMLGDTIVNILKHFKNKLKATAKEINPKQTKPVWDKKKNRWSPGNGILIPFKSCIQIEYVSNPKGSMMVSHSEFTFRKSENPWIKNENMETGNLEEFLDYADTIEIDQSYFDSLPLNLPEEKEDKKEVKQEEETTEEKTDFTEPNARPLSEKNPLSKIIQNIKNKKEHHRGGTFDNHVTDFIFGAMESKISDKHIHEYLDPYWQYADKEDGQYQGRNQEEYIDFKISNCRGKYDKADPGPLREQYMGDTIYILNAKTKKFYNKKTGRAYDKESYNVKFADIFPKKIEPTDFFKDHPKKQLAEEETYRPDLHKENDPLIKGADDLYYLNSYKPGKIKPIKPETEGDIKPWKDLLEHVVPIKEEREFLLDWLAHIVQNPWVKNRVIILIYTKKQRFGKGSIFDTMTDILGETNAEPTDVKGILDKGVTFAEKQFILIDECKSVGGWGEKSNLVNDLKKIATETRIKQRKLYVDYQVIETQTCYIVFTNEPDALNMDKEDERYMVIKNENPKKDKSWYKAYHKWRKDKGSSYVYYMLKNRNIKHFDPNASAPKTKAKEEMQEDTGHPLSLKLKEMLDEGRYPLTLDTKIISSTELKEYISKYHKGKHVQYVNDPKVLRRSLIDIGAIDLGQVLHKQHNWKPSLWIVRDHEEMEKQPKPKLCNEIWKPISTDSSPSEKHEEEATDRFMNNQTNGANAFEKRFSTNCWSCGTPIDTDSNEKCPECNFAIKCDCGQCICDKPQSPVKKLHQYSRNR